jgi:hypothetical protein
MKKKKNKKRVDGFVFPVPFAGALIIIATLALAYVWMGCRCEALGREIKGLEREKEVLDKKCLREEYRWTQMKAPRNLERVLAKHNIRMSWPKPEQVVRLAAVETFETRRMMSHVSLSERVAMNE